MTTNESTSAGFNPVRIVLTDETLARWEAGYSKGHRRAVWVLRPFSPEQRAEIVREAHIMMNATPIRFADAVAECAPFVTTPSKAGLCEVLGCAWPADDSNHCPDCGTEILRGA